MNMSARPPLAACGLIKDPGVVKVAIVNILAIRIVRYVISVQQH